MRCLLDKVTARYSIQGLLKLAGNQELDEEELFSLDLLSRARLKDTHLFITPPTANILHNLSQSSKYAGVIELFLNRVEVALPTRYFKRWARRLRGYNFTREDAAVLALATFGTNQNTTIISMNFVVTFDQPMITNWVIRQEDIKKQLTAMQKNIPARYRRASLPQVLRPEQIEI